MVCYLKRPTVDTKFVPPKRPAIVGRSTSQCHAYFNFSRLHSGSPTLYSDSSSPLAFTCFTRHRSSRNIWMRSFKIYGKWSVQASKHRYTRMCNAVTLVWVSPQLSTMIERTITLGSTSEHANLCLSISAVTCMVWALSHFRWILARQKVCSIVLKKVPKPYVSFLSPAKQGKLRFSGTQCGY